MCGVLAVKIFNKGKYKRQCNINKSLSYILWDPFKLLLTLFDIMILFLGCIWVYMDLFFMIGFGRVGNTKDKVAWHCHMISQSQCFLKEFFSSGDKELYCTGLCEPWTGVGSKVQILCYCTSVDFWGICTSLENLLFLWQIFTFTSHILTQISELSPRYIFRIGSLLQFESFFLPFGGLLHKNQDKGFSQDFPVILAEFNFDSVAQKQVHISCHGDLFFAACSRPGLQPGSIN